MVKVIRFLLAIHIGFLSVYPCSDSETCADEQKSGITYVDNNSHEHSSDEQDLCSPFCICACCAAHIQLNHVADITFTNMIHNTKVSTLYREKPMLNNSHSIWQPPKIS
jgi:hypothetical protein